MSKLYKKNGKMKTKSYENELASGVSDALAEIAPHLTAPVEVVDNLVLEGVLALATADQ